MQQIINFIIKNRNGLLFMFLMIVAFTLTIHSNSYHNSKFVSSTSNITGYVNKKNSLIGDYFRLNKINKKLLEENSDLRNQIENLKRKEEILNTDFTDSINKYHYIPIKVISNSFHKTKNHISFNKGTNQGLKADMGVVNDKGIVGVIEQCSGNYSRALSILNTNLKINAKLKKSNHFGSLSWDGTKTNLMKLVDIPVLAPIKVGDTIITGGMSTIFPEGIPIGKISDFKQNTGQSFYTISVILFNDMTSINNGYAIENLFKDEIQQINSLNE